MHKPAPLVAGLEAPVIDIASMAAMQAQRLLTLLHQPPLSVTRVSPLCARRAGASGDQPLSHGSPSSLRGPAVEAGRSADNSQDVA